MNATVPAALAVAGTALMAVAFFGPFRRTVDTDDVPETSSHRNGTVMWPALVDPSAAASDVATRIDLADALGTLQSAWADEILRKAYESEPDPGVRAVISTALTANQSLVT